MPLEQFRKKLIQEGNQKRAKYLQIVMRDEEEKLDQN